jgi:hydroxymethylbilane synthase
VRCADPRRRGPASPRPRGRDRGAAGPHRVRARAGAGALAVEGREIPAGLVHPGTDAQLHAERHVVEALAATCDTPVGVHHDGTALHAFVGLPDGSAWLRDSVVAAGAGAAGAAASLLVERLESMGARALLARAEALAAEAS